MAIKLISTRWNTTLNALEDRYILDSAADIPLLPESSSNSRALIADTGTVYIVNASGGWEETVLPSGGGDPSEPETPTETLIYGNPLAGPFVQNASLGGAYVYTETPATFTFEYGKTYKVIWDDIEYLVAPQPFAALGAVVVGNIIPLGGVGAGEPFAIGYVESQNTAMFASFTSEETHTIEVYEVLDNQCGGKAPFFSVNELAFFETTDTTRQATTAARISLLENLPAIITVRIDDNFYACPPTPLEIDGVEHTLLGNLSIADSSFPDTGLPFVVDLIPTTSGISILVLTTLAEASHDISLYYGATECTGSGGDGDVSEITETLERNNLNLESVLNMYYSLPTVDDVTGGSSYEVGCPEWIDDICFWDFDGTLVFRMTVDAASTLSTLPSPAAHEGLTFQGWNFSLDEIQNTKVPLDIGAIYIPTDNKTHIIAEMTDEENLSPTTTFLQTVSNGVIIDWGDGTVETLEGIGEVAQTHTYATTGTYEVTFNVQVGCTMTIGAGSNAKTIFGGTSAVYRSFAKAIHVGHRTELGSYAIYGNNSFSTVTIPFGINTTLVAQSFGGSLGNFFIPSGVTTIQSNAIARTSRDPSNFSIISIPSSVTTLEASAIHKLYKGVYRLILTGNISSLPDDSFSNCDVFRLYIPDSITTIGSNFLAFAHNLKKFIFPRSLTSIGADCFKGKYFDFEMLVYPATMETISSMSSSANLNNVYTLIFHGKCGTTQLSLGAKRVKEIILTSNTDYSGLFSSGSIVSSLNYPKIYVQDEFVENYKSVFGTYGYSIFPLSEYQREIPK